MTLLCGSPVSFDELIGYSKLQSLLTLLVTRLNEQDEAIKHLRERDGATVRLCKQVDQLASAESGFREDLELLKVRVDGLPGPTGVQERLLAVEDDVRRQRLERSKLEERLKLERLKLEEALKASRARAEEAVEAQAPIERRIATQDTQFKAVDRNMQRVQASLSSLLTTGIEPLESRVDGLEHGLKLLGLQKKEVDVAPDDPRARMGTGAIWTLPAGDLPPVMQGVAAVGAHGRPGEAASPEARASEADAARKAGGVAALTVAEEAALVDAALRAAGKRERRQEEGEHEEQGREAKPKPPEAWTERAEEAPSTTPPAAASSAAARPPVAKASATSELDAPPPSSTLAGPVISPRPLATAFEALVTTPRPAATAAAPPDSPDSAVNDGAVGAVPGLASPARESASNYDAESFDSSNDDPPLPGVGADDEPAVARPTGPEAREAPFTLRADASAPAAGEVVALAVPVVEEASSAFSTPFTPRSTESTSPREDAAGTPEEGSNGAAQAPQASPAPSRDPDPPDGPSTSAPPKASALPVMEVAPADGPALAILPEAERSSAAPQASREDRSQGGDSGSEHFSDDFEASSQDEVVLSPARGAERPTPSSPSRDGLLTLKGSAPSARTTSAPGAEARLVSSASADGGLLGKPALAAASASEIAAAGLRGGRGGASAGPLRASASADALADSGAGGVAGRSGLSFKPPGRTAGSGERPTAGSAGSGAVGSSSPPVGVYGASGRAWGSGDRPAPAASARPLPASASSRLLASGERAAAAAGAGPGGVGGLSNAGLGFGSPGGGGGFGRPTSRAGAAASAVAAAMLAAKAEASEAKQAGEKGLRKAEDEAEAEAPSTGPRHPGKGIVQRFTGDVRQVSHEAGQRFAARRASSPSGSSSGSSSFVSDVISASASFDNDS